jgi:hypothetical protein
MGNLASGVLLTFQYPMHRYSFPILGTLELLGASLSSEKILPGI